MPVSVEVRPRYVRRARQLANERSASFEGVEAWYRDAGEQGWGHESERRHFIGTLGEMAFSTYYGAPIDTERYSRTDQGGDFCVRIDNGDFDNEEVRVDVKSSPVDDPQLLVTEGQIDADYYVLCRVPEDALDSEGWVTVEMLGGATKEMVLNREPIQSPNYGHYYHAVSNEFLLELPSPEDVHLV